MSYLSYYVNTIIQNILERVNMETIDLDEIRQELKKHPPCLIAKETGYTYRHIYRFLRSISGNPTTEFVNKMIEFINKNKE